MLRSKLFLSVLILFLSGCTGPSIIGTQAINYVIESGDSVDFTAVTKSNDGAGSGLDLDLLDGVEGSVYSQLGSTIESSEITDGTLVDEDFNASAAIAQTKLAFADGDANFTATDPGAAIEELDDTNGSGPNAADGKVDWTQIQSIPAGFADGADAVGAGPTLSDVTAQDVSGSASAQGVASDASRSDHAHRGVFSFRKAGDTVLYGAITLSEGTNATLTQVGQDIEIAATAAATADEAYISKLASDIEVANDDAQTHFTLRNKMVDTVRDSSGINAGASSNYTVRGSADFDIAVSSGTATVIWNSFTSSAAPTEVILHANTTNGSPTWSVSRDNGSTYTTVTENTLTTFTSTSGSTIVLKASFSGTIEVDDVAVQVIP